MFRMENAVSIGYIEYGNTFFEVMTENGKVGMVSHNDESEENSDGSFNGEFMSIEEFKEEIKHRVDYKVIVRELNEVICLAQFETSDDESDE